MMETQKSDSDSDSSQISEHSENVGWEFDEPITICPKLDAIEAPVKFFKVDKLNEKLYVYGSNDVLVAIDLKHDNEISKLALNPNPNIIERVFCIDEIHNTIVEGASTPDNGYMSLLGSSHEVVTFDVPIRSIDSHTTSVRSRNLDEDVTEVLLTLANGSLRIFKIVGNEAMDESKSHYLDKWNKTEFAKIARFYYRDFICALDWSEKAHWILRAENISDMWPLVLSIQKYLTGPLYILNDRYLIFYNHPNRINVVGLRIDFVFDTDFPAKPNSIVSTDEYMLIGQEDGTILLYSLDLLSSSVDLQNKETNRADGSGGLMATTSFCAEGDPTDAAKDLSLDLLVEPGPSSKSFAIYAIGSNLRITCFKMASPEVSLDLILIK